MCRHGKNALKEVITQKGSVYGMLCMVTGRGQTRPTETFDSIVEKSPAVYGKVTSHWGDKTTFGFSRKLLYVLHRTRKALARPLVSAFRASRAYRAWAQHMHTCRFVDPASKTNARCWNDASSNLRVVYDAMVTHRPVLPPCVAHVYLRQRRVVYRSVTGPLDVWVRPRTIEMRPPGTEMRPSGGRSAVVATGGLRFTAPVPRWVRCVWAMERVVFAVVDRIARSLASRRRTEHRNKRSYHSRMLYQLS